MSGSVPGADAGHETFDLQPATGRMLTPEDQGNVVVLGSTIARKHGVSAGGVVDLRGEAFQVIGTLQATLTSPDITALVPLATAQRLYLADLPPLVAENLVAEELVNQIIVYPDAGADFAVVAAAIESSVENAATMTGAEWGETVGATTTIFNAIILGVAAISLIVGGLSVINTMAMTVAERTREIGIKRAIGGSRTRIIRELVAEAGVIGLIGGLVGLALGAFVVTLVNDAGRAGGTVLFDLTPQTALFAVGFSTILAMVAGVLPGLGCRPARPGRGPPLRMKKEHPMQLIEATGLHKTYRLSRRASIEALRGVDVRIGAGEMVALMGPSGSGKSTLMHILGLLHAPDGGDGSAPSLWIDGIDVTSLSDRERTRIRARSMGFVFQSFNLVPTLTAEENVALAAQYAGTSGRAARAAARQALDAVGLAERAGHRPMELSGGEQQRVAIARALVNQPQLILGDEPTGNLDSARTADVLSLLRRFNRERGQTMLIVTHDPDVGATCDRIIRMRDGVIVADERVPVRATLEADVFRRIASSTPGAAIPVAVA